MSGWRMATVPATSKSDPTVSKGGSLKWHQSARKCMSVSLESTDFDDEIHAHKGGEHKGKGI